jgi:hypothetical protein
VKKKEFETYLHHYHPELFSFAFSLVPDDLQAEQIVIDSVANVLVSEKDFIQELLDQPFLVENSKRNNDELFKKLLHAAYMLGEKRFYQIGDSLQTSEKKRSFAAFYRLCVLDKAVLYLNYKLNFKAEDIAIVTGGSKLDVIPMLDAAKFELTQLMGVDFGEGMIPS